VRSPARESGGSRSAQRNALYLTVFLAQLGTAVAVPILPTLRDTFGVSVTAVALTTSVWGLARLAVDLPVGAITNRIPPGRVLLAGIMLIGSGSTLAALAPSFAVLLVGRAVAGAGSGMVAITVIVRLIALSEPGARGRTLAFYQGALQAGSSLSPAAAGLASSLFGWPAAFGLAAITAFAGALAAWLTGALGTRAKGSSNRPEGPEGAEGTEGPAVSGAGPHVGPGARPHGAPEAAVPAVAAAHRLHGAPEAVPAGAAAHGAHALACGEPGDLTPSGTGHGSAGPNPGRRIGVGRGSSLAFALVVVNVATFTIFFTNGALFQNAIPLFAGIRIGLGAATIGLILGAATLLRFVVGLIGGTLSDRYGRHMILVIGFVLLAITTTTFPLAGGVVGFTVASLLLSGTRLGNAVSVALLSDRVGEDQAGRWVSVNRFVGDTGLLLGPAVTGAVIDAAGFEPAFWLTAGLAATAAATVGADQWFNRGLARSRLA
jgi:MFS transporter, DHA1 family, multidrug resistance protein